MNLNPKNTLAYYNATPQVQLFNLRHIPATDVAINCKTLHEDKGGDGEMANPGQQALEFYALNHLASIVRKKFTLHEQLPEWAAKVMAAYQKSLRDQGRRIMNYMILITTRESRHVRDKPLPIADVVGEAKMFKDGFKAKFGEVLYEFHDKINDTSSSYAAEAFMEQPPVGVDMGTYCDALPYVFYKGRFSSSFGGKPWGLIADTLSSFINGHISMEMLLDTAYTLAHNNGPMFNKGMMYSMYTPNLLKILDVQRSGQVPELILSGFLPLNSAVNGVKDLVQEVAELFPNEFGPEVDWYKVEDLGSLHKYPQEKKAMKVQPPPTPPKPKMKDGKLVIGEFVVTPNQKVDIIQRSTEIA